MGGLLLNLVKLQNPTATKHDPSKKLRLIVLRFWNIRKYLTISLIYYVRAS
jgi:hypothetical protein